MFKSTLNINDLKTYVMRQINNFFPDDRLSLTDPLLMKSFNQAMERSEYCFRHVALKTYHDKDTTFFSHLHSDQYSVFLWFLSNSVWREFQDAELASKMFYLNKVLNGFICMYDAEMPNIFLVLHGGGIVLGKASYSDFFVCCQGCTVGAVHGVYPSLGKGVAMAPQSTIVGNCIIGDHSTIGNQALLRNKNLKSKSLYYRDIDTGHHLILQRNDSSWAQTFFNVPIPFEV
ncbi:hypothetical protein M3223_22975 [Paenibacillus pasadenensis]|uniref:hypothetical protein n=1 Tax=Paenibacillus pasadenensis TaxID=217090 RepID=UPI00203D5CBE|nr:hypothetical protein [Paenibacillus pasadenensis]MCM3750204.1 hypothetical protein [Paenibacillus pasadenensis]